MKDDYQLGASDNQDFGFDLLLMMAILMVGC
jgi:hypothetical protein